MKKVFLFLFSVLSFSAFAQDDFTVNIHELGDPDGFNPLTSIAANGLYMQGNIFCRLLDFNRETFELEPVLAVERPIIEAIETGKYKGGMSLVYEIHPDAVWDNGSPVTAADYIFTIKAIRNPKVKSEPIRPYFEFIDDIVVDFKNNKKFTIYSKQRYFRAEESSGYETFVLPEYHYDPTGIMKKFSLKALASPDKLLDNSNILSFAESFNASVYAREPDKVVGCGPYRFVNWTVGQRITLERKKDWWGDKSTDRKCLKAYPNQIVYKIMPDFSLACLDAKYGKIDIMRSISPEQYFELKEDSVYNRIFNFENPAQFAYHYLGFNRKIPQLSDVSVRKAIAHAVDRDFIINEIFEGEAIKQNTPISPFKPYYNKAVKDVTFDLEKSRRLLKEAGWADSDGDGILDKEIKGELVSLNLKYNYNQGNYVRKEIGKMLKRNLAKIKVKLNLKPVSFPDLLDIVDERKFEIMALAWVKIPGLDDMKQVWHTDSDKPRGSNRVAFGTEETDDIIDEIRETFDPKKRKELYLKIQEKIAEDQPYVFLIVPNELMMVRKSLSYPKLTPMRPGYETKLFQLNKK